MWIARSGTRGWPAGAAAEAVFSVQDDLFPDNAGAWRLTVRDGEAAVTRETGDPGVRPLPIGALSADVHRCPPAAERRRAWG